MQVKENKFKVGDKVKILRKDTTFGWDGEMQKYIGKEGTIEAVRNEVTSSFNTAEGYVIDGWFWSVDALELVKEDTKDINPERPQRGCVLAKPGDKIICNNGEEFVCCTLESLTRKRMPW